MTDHLDAQRIDPQQLVASIRRGLADAAAGRTEYLGRFADDEPEPEPDYDPRPDGCCGHCPPILGGGYDCTCADNPRCDANHADRYDRDGDRWEWCGGCDGLRMGIHHGMHESSYGWTAAELDEARGPLTFAPRPADTPTTAPQPEQAHGDADESTKPNLNAQTAPSIPTTQQVRDAYVDQFVEFWRSADGDEFDRWLAAHDAEVAAKALRQAADEASQEGERILDGMPDAFSGLGRERGRRMDDAQECRARANWLRDRADQIEQEQP